MRVSKRTEVDDQMIEVLDMLNHYLMPEQIKMMLSLNEYQWETLMVLLDFSNFTHRRFTVTEELSEGL